MVRRKAQIWSLDFAMSLLIFFSALFSVMFAWNHISASTLQNQEIKDLQLMLLTLSDSLIRTPGMPADWDRSSVEVIGLAQDENVLNVTKVLEFVNLSADNYSLVQGLLGVAPYDFYFELVDLNGTVRQNTSMAPDPASHLVVPAERYVVYGGRIAKMRIVIWE